jgi:4-nitrophenyl phosphatase
MTPDLESNLTPEQQEFVTRAYKYTTDFISSQPEICTSTDNWLTALSRDSVIRFCIANNWNYSNTIKALEKWVRWRLEKRPHSVKREEILAELETQKAYWYGVDREGHPVCVMKPHFHSPLKRDYEQCLKFAFWSIEEGVKLMNSTTKDGKCVILYDAQKVGFSNLDLSMFRDIMETIQKYPERLLKCCVYKPNWSFSALLTTVSPFLDPVTKSKICTIRTEKELFEFIDPEFVQKEYGGESNYDLLKELSSTEQ